MNTLLMLAKEAIITIILNIFKFLIRRYAMTAESGVIDQLETRVAAATQAEQQELGRETAALVRRYDEHAPQVTNRAILRYFWDKEGEPATPEDIAVIHYLESGNKGLPSQDKLVPRTEAAETALEAIAGTDMLLVPNGDYNSVVALTNRADRSVRLMTDRMRASRNGFSSTEFELPGGNNRAGTFNLVGSADLATPITTDRDVDLLFKRRKEDVRHAGTRGLEPKAHLPLILGHSAISRVAVNLGMRTPLKDIEATALSDYGFQFSSLTGILSEIDPEISTAVVEEVRERRPKAIRMVQQALQKDLDWELSMVLENRDENRLERVHQWFNADPVKLFYTGEELEDVRDGLARSHKAALDQRIIDFEKSTAQRAAAFTEGLKT